MIFAFYKDKLKFIKIYCSLLQYKNNMKAQIIISYMIRLTIINVLVHLIPFNRFAMRSICREKESSRAE